jgi:hypothetical protein
VIFLARSHLHFHFHSHSKNAIPSTQGAPVGDAANSEQAELALHPDPHLEARNRIQPTQANPKGYPPFDLRQMPSYTNNQLRYYLTRGQVTDMSAFTKAQHQREDLNRTLGLRGDTDDEDELSRFDTGDAPPTDHGSHYYHSYSHHRQRQRIRRSLLRWCRRH